MWAGTKLFIVVTDPLETDIILNKKKFIEKKDLIHILRAALNNGLISAPG